MQSTHTCPICKKKLKNVKSLNIHLKTTCRKTVNIEDNQVRLLDRIEEHTSEEDTEETESICEYSIERPETSDEDLIRSNLSIRSSSGYRSPVTPRSPRSQGIGESTGCEIKSKKIKVFMCTGCNKKLSSKQMLIYHTGSCFLYKSNVFNNKIQELENNFNKKINELSIHISQLCKNNNSQLTLV